MASLSKRYLILICGILLSLLFLFYCYSSNSFIQYYSNTMKYDTNVKSIVKSYGSEAQNIVIASTLVAQYTSIETNLTSYESGQLNREEFLINIKDIIIDTNNVFDNFTYTDLIDICNAKKAMKLISNMSLLLNNYKNLTPYISMSIIGGYKDKYMSYVNSSYVKDNIIQITENYYN